jgi:ubiquitin-protein ligase
MALQRRLLQDIAELQADPYPNIVLFIRDDLQETCLLLTPSGKEPLHLTLKFGADYPLRAPTVTIESHIVHPNVFGSYICASILNTEEGYTPAYTLKGMAIQLLSFFSSDRIEQEGGGYSVELDKYSRDSGDHPFQGLSRRSAHAHDCDKCGFGGSKVNQDLVDTRSGGYEPSSIPTKDQDSMDINEVESLKGQRTRLIERILALPDELLLLILAELDTKDLLAAAKVCSKLGGFLQSYDCIRLRELQCFCFKDNFLNAKLGVGVHCAGSGRQGTFESEFDLLSQQAFEQFRVRRSIQGLGFEHWLPLPISRRHWRSVRADVKVSLRQLGYAAAIPDDRESNEKVIYSFMNDVVIKLSREAESTWGDRPKSTLTHASEKAVESYFSLFHLLLCLATEQPQIVRDANRLLLRFMEGHTSKSACPNLGLLLVAVLVSDQGLTEELTMAIIKEAILRNVVWMLDYKGAGMAELSYIEPSAVSNYRLQRTFEASKVSYRILMFLALFYKTARAEGKPIANISDDIFDMHGAPPRGTAEKLAQEIRNIRTVSHFSNVGCLFGILS